MQARNGMFSRFLVCTVTALAACTEGGDDGDTDVDVVDTDVLDTEVTDTTETDVVDTDVEVPLAPVSIRLTHVVGADALAISSETPYTNAAGDAFGVTKLVYFLSDVTLTMDDGTVVSAPGAHYVDVQTEGTLAFDLPDDAPAAGIDTVSFVIGLTPALNVSGAFPSAPESLMEWPEMMGGGYHFMKQEGNFIAANGNPASFKTHTGGLDGTDYAIAVELDAGDATIAESGADLTLQMDLLQWYRDPTVWDFDDHKMGVMMDPVAQATLQANGADVFTLAAVDAK